MSGKRLWVLAAGLVILGAIGYVAPKPATAEDKAADAVTMERSAEPGEGSEDSAGSDNPEAGGADGVIVLGPPTLIRGSETRTIHADGPGEIISPLPQGLIQPPDPEPPAKRTVADEGVAARVGSVDEQARRRAEWGLSGDRELISELMESGFGIGGLLLGIVASDNELAVMQERLDREFELEGVWVEMRAELEDVFAEAFVDHQTGETVIQLTDVDVPSTVLDRLAADGHRVVRRLVTHSAVELLDVADRISNLRSDNFPFELVSVGVNRQLVAVEVRVSGDLDGAKRVIGELVPRGGVVVLPADAVDADDRSEVFPPVQAGLSIDPNSGGTVAYGVNRDDANFVLTAGHGVVDGVSYGNARLDQNNTDPNPVFGVASDDLDTGQATVDADVALISVPTFGVDSDCVYINDTTCTSVLLYYTGDIADLPASVQFCQSGATSGAGHCGPLEMASTQYTSSAGTTYLNVARAGYCGEGGDSGAPIYTVLHILGIPILRALGVNSGGNAAATCSSNPADDYAFFTPLSVVLDELSDISMGYVPQSLYPVNGTYEPVVGDFDGSGRADVFWYAPGSASDSAWYGNADRDFSKKPFTVSGTYEPLVGDFDGDGRDDIFWYAPGPGQDTVWFWQSQTSVTTTVVSVSGTYEPLVGDFNADGRDDIFWYAAGPTGDSVWYATGNVSNPFTSSAASVNGTYTPFVGNFNSAGAGSDVFWYAPGPAGDTVWYGVSNNTFIPRSASVSGVYTPTVGDFDTDGRDDVLWYAASGGSDPMWYGTTTLGSFDKKTSSLLPSRMPLVLDINDDGRDDVFLYGAGSVSDYIYHGMPGRELDGGIFVTVSGSYEPLTGDFDGLDTRGDVFWYAAGSALDYMWWG